MCQSAYLASLPNLSGQCLRDYVDLVLTVPVNVTDARGQPSTFFSALVTKVPVPSPTSGATTIEPTDLSTYTSLLVSGADVVASVLADAWSKPTPTLPACMCGVFNRYLACLQEACPAFKPTLACARTNAGEAVSGAAALMVAAVVGTLAAVAGVIV
ncbi:hypothetical protein HDU96_006431 [Phlyctochytrium bullatum]|nr:hypothetical protein HDU96_006431 [Phlyctochytrium bullatum]